MSTTSSRNFTTLYSGSGSVTPQGAYGNANVVSLLAAGTDGANTVTTISATGNIVTDAYFVGNFAGNITGNIAVTGSNTQVLFNNAGNVGAAAGLTFNSASNVLATTGSVTATGNVQGNYFIGNGSQLTGLPATYGNANVAANLAAFGSNPISTTGNVTAGYFVGDGSQLTNLPIGGYSNANVASFMAVFGSNVISSTGNITGNVFSGNGAGLTNINGANIIGGYGNANVSAYLASGTNTANITTTGNITGANITTAGNVFGNVIATTVSGIGTANLVLKSFDTSTNANGIVLDANIVVVGSGSGAGIVGASNKDLGIRPYYGATNQPQLTLRKYTGPTDGNVDMITAATGTVGVVNLYGNVNVGATAGVPGSQGNLTVANSVSVGGAISATGNITANTSSFFIGNGSLLTGIISSYGNANVVNLLANFGSNVISTTGNITAGNLIATTVTYTPQVESQATDLDLNTPGQINANGNLRVGDNNANTQIATHGTGDLILRTHDGSATEGSITIFDGVNGNIDIAPNGTGTVTTTTLSATGNITGANIIGNGQYLTNITAANVSGTVGLAQYVTANAQANITSLGTLTSLSVSGNTTSGNLLTPGLVSATANITGGNLITAGTISASASTANVLLSNIRITAQNVNSGQQYTATTAPDFTVSNTTINPGRMLFGNGFQGNVSNGVDAFSRQTKSRFGFWDTAQLPASYSGAAVNLTSTAQYQLAGNTGSTSRLFSTVNFNLIASEGTGNTFTSTGTVPAAVAGFNTFAIAGNWVGNTTGGMANVGNVIVNTASGGIFGTIVNGGSTMGNAFGVVATNQSSAAAGTTATINNQIYFAPWDSLTTAGTITTPGNVFAYYNPGVTNSYGVTHANTMRGSANYYFLRNDDDVAQAKLGSLRTYHEYQYSTATSGTVNIDKTNAQIQYINPTANITIGSYLNFVTTANDGTNNDNQTDTVTLIIQQGATPYTVTMPTGNASIKYAGNVTTVGATANSVTMISISAIRSSANAALYLTTISPEFV